MGPELVRIKASAGAGKTYALSLRYLELLKRYGDLRGIVAITFTNKAASEMKERILRFLKEMALGVERAKELSERLKFPDAESARSWASNWVDRILEDYSYFQVRTIDSLLYSILKALSFELGLSAELNVVFDREQVFNAAFDEFVFGIDGSYREYWDELLTTFFEIDDKGGFNPERGVKKRLLGLWSDLSKGGVDFIRHDDDGFNKAVVRLRKAVSDFLERLYELDAGRGLLKSGYRDLLDGLEEATVRELSDVGRKLASVSSFEGFFDNRKLKKAGGVCFSGLVVPYQRFLEAWVPFCRYFAVSRVSAYVRALMILRALVEGMCRREGIVIGGEDWVELVGKKLKEEEVVPLVFAFFGARFQHFLFDEFQDTSRKQWETLFPLVEEALSKGGSFFFVGDVKQAIYRWRGGDWELFDEVFDKRVFKSVGEDARKDDVLEHNYRSFANLVEFFNGLFEPLEREGDVLSIIGDSIKEDRAKEKTAFSIASAYRNFEQKPKLSYSPEARVEVCVFTDGAGKTLKGEALKEAVRKKLVDVVKDRYHQSAVLVRDNKQVEEISRWLLEEGIPVITEGALRMDSSRVVKGLLNALAYIARGDDFYLFGVLSSGIVDLDGLELTPESWLEKRDAFRNLVDERLEGCRRYSTVYQLLRKVYEALGVEGNYPDISLEMPFVERLFEVAHLFDLNNPPDADAFVAMWEEGRLEGRLGLPESVEAVYVMTVHKAKGLEFPVVVVPYTNWRFWDSWGEVCVLEDFEIEEGAKGTYLAELGADDRLDGELLHIKYVERGKKLQETLNLLYVALTRAKRELYLFVTDPRKDNMAGLLKRLLEGAKDGTSVKC